VSTANGHASASRAARRRVANDTPTLGAGAAGDTLAQVIGVAVAQALAPMLAQLVPQKTGCLYCCARLKIVQTAWAGALAAARTVWEIACKAAAELGDSAPEWAEPQPPALPEVQEAFTWVPVQPVRGAAPVTIPVCYDDLPDRPAEDAPAEAQGPAFRDVGIVTGDGRPVVAQG